MGCAATCCWKVSGLLFGRDWRSPFLSVAALTGGRASLKRHLATASAVDAATLPYDQDVIAYAEAWRKSGGRTALVTASDSDFAGAIADHLGIFDEVHGSDGTLNLKGEHKGQFLEERFGPRVCLYGRCQGRSACLETGRQGHHRERARRIASGSRAALRKCRASRHQCQIDQTLHQGGAPTSMAEKQSCISAHAGSPPT